MKRILLATSASCAITCAGAACAQVADLEDDAIGVTGQRAQQERSIALKRSAIGVLDVAAADDIGRLPDRNVAEVVEHLPGVGVSYDQGKGRFVAIWGVTSNLRKSLSQALSGQFPGVLSTIELVGGVVSLTRTTLHTMHVGIFAAPSAHEGLPLSQGG